MAEEDIKKPKDEVVVKAKDLQILIDKVAALESGKQVLKEEIATRNKTATLAIIGNKPAYVVKVSQAQLMVHQETKEQRYFVTITDHKGNTHEMVDLATFLGDCEREAVEIEKGSGKTQDFFVTQSMVDAIEIKAGDWKPTPLGYKVPAGYTFSETTVQVNTELAGSIRVPVDCLNIVGAMKKNEVTKISTDKEVY